MNSLRRETLYYLNPKDHRNVQTYFSALRLDRMYVNRNMKASILAKHRYVLEEDLSDSVNYKCSEPSIFTFFLKRKFVVRRTY
jgi:hypothetical protein